MEAACEKRKEVQIFGKDYDTRDGTCIRDYIHVSDLAIGHVQALGYLAKNDTSLTVNLGSEAGISVLEMLEHARRITGQAIPAGIAPRRAGDPARLTSSAKLAKETLGWTAQHSNPETLIRTSWDAYRRHL
jgi:UDP-glucose 4-epimerase